ncbi:Lrp/AsnC family transcriptional regulator [Arthrobacter sp. 35W]|uniref:Lrp/AsnC family transcriptional regulator n=1 Tax=Arthrobacter sp. 35W TaxID=1132441 RepID=UPI00040DB11E|nr:Lrp/AsnC family transcriptional regulator [Arthrobacter sp. 35W]
MESRNHDGPDLDHIIANALQVNGRASWEAISRAIDVPSRTVMRRGQSLLETGRVRVSTYVDASKLLHARGVLLRVRAEISKVASVARSIAALPDASSVSILEGAGDIAALVLVRNTGTHRTLLLETLPDIAGIESFEVSTVLRPYRIGLDWQAGLLSDDQIRILSKGLPDQGNMSGPGPVVLDELDQTLIQQLSEDGRATISMLASHANINSQTVRRRLDALLGVGVLRVRTEVDPEFFDYKVEALIWLHINSGDVETIGSGLATHPLVRYCAATTGHAGLLVDALFKDEEALFHFQNDTIGALSTVEIAESRVVLEAVKRGPLLIGEHAA